MNLETAVINGDLKQVKKLIREGGDVNYHNEELKSLLHRAVGYGHYGVTKFLVQHGANIEARNLYNYTPLHLAVAYGHYKVTKFLLEAGADIEAEPSVAFQPDRALHIAAEKGYLKIVELLVRKGANISSRNAYGQCPIDVAYEYGHVDIVSFIEREWEHQREKQKALQKNKYGFIGEIICLAKTKIR